jgi:Na+/H+ antiporter NhaD/arsenite permease-like protein
MYLNRSYCYEYETRNMSLVAGIIVLSIFVIALLAIMSERVNDTAASLMAFGISATVVYFLDGVQFVDYASGIGWDVILFVAAMMIIVSVVASSGLFQYLGIILALRTFGNPRRIFNYFMVLVFIISLLFDPLPTMLIVSAFTVEVCNAIDVDFRPYLMTEAVIAGIGSMPTPIGSVTNLVMVYLAEINIALMFVVILPLSIILFLVTMWYMLRKFSIEINDTTERDMTDLFSIDPNVAIRSKQDLIISSVGMGILVLGLIILPQQAAMLALVIAGALLMLSKDRAKELLRRLSWDTVFFLMGIMGIVQGLVLTDVIANLAAGLQWLSEANVFLAIVLMVMVPGGVMAPMDAKAVGILLAPAAKNLTAINPMVPLALIAGTNAGSYVVPFGDAPNMVVVSISEKNLKPLSWTEFNKVVIPLGLIHLVIIIAYFGILSLFFS